MRRKDREIKEFSELIRVMEDCDVCRLALNDQGYPYIVPVNFGMEAAEGKVILYFHGAAEGRKYELIGKDPRAGFEMDCSHKLVTDRVKENCTMKYESVVGRGTIEIVPEEEKYHALCVLLKHYHVEEFQISKAAMTRTAVFRLTAEEISGKANR